MFLSELFNFIRYHLHSKVPMEVGVSDIPMCINDVPKYLVLKSLNDVSVGLLPASPQLYAVGPHRLQYCLYNIAYCVSTGPIFFPWANTFSFILIEALRVFSWHVPSSATWHPASWHITIWWTIVTRENYVLVPRDSLCLSLWMWQVAPTPWVETPQTNQIWNYSLVFVFFLFSNLFYNSILNTLEICTTLNSNEQTHFP